MTNLYHHHTKQGKTQTISSKVKNETRMSTLLALFKHSFGIPSQSNKTEGRNKGIQIGKEEVKISLFGDVLYI
jgi:hypothetical protein